MRTGTESTILDTNFTKPHEFMTTSGILKLAVIGVISVCSAYPFNPWLGSLPPLRN
jgi:hypothetical protein